MALFDRSHTGSYSSFVVTMAGKSIAHMQRRRHHITARGLSSLVQLNGILS